MEISLYRVCIAEKLIHSSANFRSTSVGLLGRLRGSDTGSCSLGFSLGRQDVAVVGEAVEHRGRELLVLEHRDPLAEE